MMGVGAETLELSAGGYSEGGAEAEGSDTVSVVGWVWVAFWRELSAAESIRDKEDSFCED
jgi:hypothetical protein